MKQRICAGAVLLASGLACLAGCARSVKQTDPDLKISAVPPPGYAQAHPKGAPGGLHRQTPAAPK